MITEKKILQVLQKHTNQVENGGVPIDHFSDVAKEILDNKSEPTTEWLYFIMAGESPSGKTKIYHVRTKEREVLIGEIKWWPPYNSYCYFPTGGLILEQTVLQEIETFIDYAMKFRSSKTNEDENGKGTTETTE